MLGNKGNTRLDNILKPKGVGSKIMNGFRSLKEKANYYGSYLDNKLKEIGEEAKIYGTTFIYLLPPVRAYNSVKGQLGYLDNLIEGAYKDGTIDKYNYKKTKSSIKFTKYLAIGVGAVGAAAIALGILFGLHDINSQPSVQVLKLPDYAFIKYDGNDQGTLYYVGPHGHLHDLGTYNLQMRPDFAQSLNVPQQFNQNVVPNNSNYVPLEQIITIYNPNGIVLPITHNNTILLDKLNPQSYTDVVVPQGFAKEYMEALGTGNYKAMAVGANGLQYLQMTNQTLWNLVLETGDMAKYAPQPYVFGAEDVIQTNNNTLIPYGFLSFTTSQTYGGNLPITNINTFYSGQ
ncbi:hypothetical protein YN1_3830 [Nanoarchaeota archaeon]